MSRGVRKAHEIRASKAVPAIFGFLLYYPFHSKEQNKLKRYLTFIENMQCGNTDGGRALHAPLFLIETQSTFSRTSSPIVISTVNSSSAYYSTPMCSSSSFSSSIPSCSPSISTASTTATTTPSAPLTNITAISSTSCTTDSHVVFSTLSSSTLSLSSPEMRPDGDYDKTGAKKPTSTESQESTAALKRKRNKPLIEKRRRARINDCLKQLQNIITRDKNNKRFKSNRLEKADILEMTVDYILSLTEGTKGTQGSRHCDQSGHLSQEQCFGVEKEDKQNAYERGVLCCIDEVNSFLTTYDKSLTSSMAVDKITDHCRSRLLSTQDDNNTLFSCESNSKSPFPDHDFSCSSPRKSVHSVDSYASDSHTQYPDSTNTSTAFGNTTLEIEHCNSNIQNKCIDTPLPRSKDVTNHAIDDTTVISSTSVKMDTIESSNRSLKKFIDYTNDPPPTTSIPVTSRVDNINLPNNSFDNATEESQCGVPSNHGFQIWNRFQTSASPSYLTTITSPQTLLLPTSSHTSQFIQSPVQQPHTIPKVSLFPVSSSQPNQIVAIPTMLPGNSGCVMPISGQICILVENNTNNITQNNLPIVSHCNSLDGISNYASQSGHAIYPPLSNDMDSKNQCYTWNHNTTRSFENTSFSTPKFVTSPSVIENSKDTERNGLNNACVSNVILFETESSNKAKHAVSEMNTALDLRSHKTIPNIAKIPLSEKTIYQTDIIRSNDKDAHFSVTPAYFKQYSHTETFNKQTHNLNQPVGIIGQPTENMLNSNSFVRQNEHDNTMNIITTHNDATSRHCNSRLYCTNERSLLDSYTNENATPTVPGVISSYGHMWRPW